ncbi:MAG: hypothetical protein ACYCQK_02840 [Acidiferrobacteraceae bacterium]
MNALTLLAIAVAIFALGYRYFARFLATAALVRHHRPADSDQYNTIARAGTEGGRPAAEYLVLIARSGAPLALIGAALLALWGWTPGYLWILTSGAVFAGAYAMIPARANTAIPPAILYGLGLVTNAFVLLVLTALLVLLPQVASAYVLELALLAALARWGTASSPAATTTAAVSGALLACVLGTAYPLAFIGHFTIESGIGSIGIGATAVWASLVMIDWRSGGGWRTAALERVAGPQLLAAIALAAVALALRHPPLAVAPFRAGPGDTRALPAIALAFAGLPFSALYWYWADEPVAAKPAAGVGHYALSALLTLSALTAFLAAASLREVTFAGSVVLPFSARPQALATLAGILSDFSGRGSRFEAFLATFAGTGIALALRTALGFGLTRQEQFSHVLLPDSRRFGDVSVLLPLALMAIALAAAPLEGWMLFGAASLLFAGRVLWTSGANLGLAKGLGGAAIAFADWGLLARLVLYWHERRALGAVIALALLLGQAWAWRPRPA